MPSWLGSLNQGPLGYEPFSNRDWTQGATNNALEIIASHVVDFGPLWLSLGATFLGNSWVKSGNLAELARSAVRETARPIVRHLIAT
jgi:hypothetical protein